MPRLVKQPGTRKREQITEKLTERLKRGVYAPGDYLPPERTLAEEFGVSRPTLRKALAPLLESKLLVNHPGVGTRIAKGGRDRKTGGGNWRIIGLLLPDIDNRFYIEITEAIEYTALQRGYQVLLCNSRHQPAIEEAHIRQFADQGVHGVILAHDPHMPFPPSVSLLKEAHIPYVALFSSPSAIACDSVLVDDYAGVNQAMRYLSSLGHRHIAFCRPIAGAQPHPREKAYLQFMAQSGNPAPPHFLIPYETMDDAAGHHALRKLFEQTPAPTALFAGNDRIALLVLKHLASLQMEVPDDVSLAGFDNLRFTEHLPVPLTTVDQPKQEMGRRAVELLLERLEFDLSPEPRVEVFQPHLVIRESCAVPSTAHYAPAALAKR